MKRLIFFLLLAMMMCSMVGCASTKAEEGDKVNSAIAQSNIEVDKTKTLVVYFSCSGHTRRIAEIISNGLEADLYEIQPAQPYTPEDLNYHDENNRSTREMHDTSIRPAIAGEKINMEKYDKIYIGHPIWWGEAPRIIDTFVESYDFSGKTIIPFCTSAASGVGASVERLKELAGNGNWHNGQRFQGTESEAVIMDWANNF